MRIALWILLGFFFISCTATIDGPQERDPASDPLDAGHDSSSSTGAAGGAQTSGTPSNGVAGTGPGGASDTGTSAGSSTGSSGANAGTSTGTGGTSAGTSSGADNGSSEDDAGANDPAGTAAIFDDFEASTIDSRRWVLRGFEGSQAANATTATIDGTRAHSGTQSVHVRDGFLEAKVPSSAFYGRMYSWFSADPGAGHWMTAVALAPGNGRDTEVRYGGHFGILEANYFGNDDEVISDPKGYCAPTCDNGVTMPIGRWACVEFYFGKDEMRLWLDGIEVETLHVKEWRNQKAPWSPAYDRVRVGFHNFQGTAPSVWLDDVAFDDARIGCAP